MKKERDTFYPISPGTSVPEILEQTGLNWRVLESTVAYGAPGENNSRPYTSIEKKALYREDNGGLLTLAGAKWMPFQNEEIIGAFVQFCDIADTPIRGISVCKKGRRIIATADYRRAFKVGATEDFYADGEIQFGSDLGDIVTCKIQLSASHEWGYGLTARIKVERLTCLNGQTVRVLGNRATISHTDGITAASATKLLQEVHHAWGKYREEANLMARTPVTVEEAKALLLRTFGKKDVMDTAWKPLEEQPKVVQEALMIFEDKLSYEGVNSGQEMLTCYYTAYGLLQAVSQFETHRNPNSERRLSSVYDGVSAKRLDRLHSELAEFSRNRQEQRVTVGV